TSRAALCRRFRGSQNIQRGCVDRAHAYRQETVLESDSFRRVRVAPSGPQIGPGSLGQTAVAVQDLVELMLLQLLQIQQGVVSPRRVTHEPVPLRPHAR